MSGYNELKNSIARVVKTNNNREITGQNLQNTLFSMVNSLGANYHFAGFATPTTNPGSPDQNVFYIADEPGVYTHFDNTEVAANSITFFMWKNAQWSYKSILFGNVTRDWIEGNYVSVEFFSRLFKAKNGETNIQVNNLVADIDRIEAQKDFYSLFGVSALGYGPGGSGGTLLEPLLSINNSGMVAPTSAENGKTIVYNSTAGKWEYGDAGGGMTGSISSKNSTVGLLTYSLYKVTIGNDATGWLATEDWCNAKFLTSHQDIYKMKVKADNTQVIEYNPISNAPTLTFTAGTGISLTGTQDGQSGSIAIACTLDISDMATKTWVGNQGFLTGITSSQVTNALGYTPVNPSTTWWGRSISNGQVKGNLYNVDNIFMTNNCSVMFRDKDDTVWVTALLFNANNDLSLGYGARINKFKTDIQGRQISFAVNAGDNDTTRKEEAAITKDGLVLYENLYLQNAKALRFRATNSNYVTVAVMDNGNNLVLGEGMVAAGYNTYLRGKTLSFQTNSNASGGAQTRMVVNGGGNVGIGTTSPGYLLDVAGFIRAQENVYVNSHKSFATFDSNGNHMSILQADGNDNLAIGYGFRVRKKSMILQGDYIDFRVNTTDAVAGTDTPVDAMTLAAGGRLWVKQATQGIRIGDGLITWDATNNALKISRISGSSEVAGNLYATGGVSALGFSAGISAVDSMSFGNLTVTTALTAAAATISGTATFNGNMTYVNGKLQLDDDLIINVGGTLKTLNTTRAIELGLLS